MDKTVNIKAAGFSLCVIAMIAITFVTLEYNPAIIGVLLIAGFTFLIFLMLFELARGYLNGDMERSGDW